MKRIFKILISLWILYHLSVILVLANGSSFVGRNWSQFFLPYGNVLGLNSSWNFFSPDPAHTMYLQYKIRYEDGQGNELKEPFEGFLPPEKNQVVVDSSKRRMLYAMRFLLLDPSRLETLMGPWLCRKYPGASEVSISYILEALPSLDVALTNSETSIADLKKEAQSNSLVYRCVSPQGENVL